MQTILGQPVTLRPADARAAFGIRLWLSDATVIGACSVLGQLLWSDSAGPGGANTYWPGSFTTAVLAFVWVMAMALTYRGDNLVPRQGRSEYKIVAIATFWAFSVFSALSLMFQMGAAYGLFLITVPIATVLMLLSRYILLQKSVANPQ